MKSKNSNKNLSKSNLLFSPTYQNVKKKEKKNKKGQNKIKYEIYVCRFVFFT